jgi:hypothetical protein
LFKKNFFERLWPSFLKPPGHVFLGVVILVAFIPIKTVNKTKSDLSHLIQHNSVPQSSMASFCKDRRRRSYLKLSHMFNTFRATLSPYLDGVELADLGIDVLTVDLRKETVQGGPYYLPMSQSRLKALENRPDFDPGFCLEDEDWNYHDGCTLLRNLWEQLTESRDGSVFSAIEKTKWFSKLSVLHLFQILSTN